MSKKPEHDYSFEHFEPFDVKPRPQWLLDLAKKYDIEIDPRGGKFQRGVMMDCTKTPGYTISLAGSQTGKSRPLLIEAIIMVTGIIPVALQFDVGQPTGVKRRPSPENIMRFGRKQGIGCGEIIGVGRYPEEKIPPKGSCPEIWISSYKEVKEKMWRKRLEALIPEDCLAAGRGYGGWNENKQTFTFNTGGKIRLNTYEQKHEKTEGEMAWMIILDEEPPVREYFISALEHCRYLRICYSPINGLGWSFTDCYQPAIEGKNKRVNIYTCTQYDTPFQEKERIDAKLDMYKLHEVKSRIFGQYTEITGIPYYDYEITQRFIKEYVPIHKLARITPANMVSSAREALSVRMLCEVADKPGDDVWEIYEPHCPTDAYWMACDIASGHENPDLAQNASCAYVMRLPRENETEPVMVAALWSKMRNVEFAWMCLYGACYWNCCLVAPETGVSADGAIFATTISDYPYLYRHVNINFRTRKPQEKIGFDTKSSTRKYAFELVGTWIQSRATGSSHIYHYRLLQEMAACIVGKEGRPDHAERGGTDCLLAFGISQYVYAMAPAQIRCNRRPLENVTVSMADIMFPNIYGLNKPIRETRPMLGTRRGLDSRLGIGKMLTHASKGD